MKKLPVLLSFILVIFLSCQSNYPNEINHVNQLLNYGDSLRIEMVNLPMHDLDDIFEETKAGIELMNKYMPDGNEKDKYMLYLNYYGEIFKTLSRTLPSYQSIQKAISESHAQLESLRHDLKHNLIPDSLVHKYITEEEMVLKQLNGQIIILKERIEMKKDLYLEVNDDIKIFLNEIKDKV